MDARDVDPESAIAITLDDLSEVERREIEQELKKAKAEKLKRFFKTKDGVVKKVTTANPYPMFNGKHSDEPGGICSGWNSLCHWPGDRWSLLYWWQFFFTAITNTATNT
jgi:hypothetical protein